VRYYGGDGDQLQFRGKPATNVSDFYVDTGKFAGDHSWNTGLELLWNVDGWSLLGEYVTASVSSSEYANPDFHGWYVTGSWVVTGEHRPYDRKAAYARRILPQGRWGAWEIVGRYGSVDLNDGQLVGDEPLEVRPRIRKHRSRPVRAHRQHADVPCASAVDLLID
jgi:phosphate-selective porin OprO/OprP